MPKLNIGCGLHPSPKNEGWINLDKFKLKDVDVVHDINTKLPFPDNHFDYIYCSHVLEHLNFDKKMYIIEELYRLSKPNGRIEIRTPNWKHPNTWIDPTHCSCWAHGTFNYFKPGDWGNYMSKARFKVIAEEVRRPDQSELRWVLEALK